MRQPQQSELLDEKVSSSPDTPNLGENTLRGTTWVLVPRTDFK